MTPQFLTADDLPTGDLLSWETEGWKGGYGAVSSFAVMDALLERVAEISGMNRITVVGNSAGGQFVNRYAAVGRAPDEIGIKVGFIVANPSTYLYFDRQRPDNGRFREAADPAVDRWRYGFTDAPGYVTESPERYFTRYRERDVVYLIGGQDADPGAVLLEVHPAALAQGRTRRERGENYHAYLEHKAGHAVHELQIAPGVGHDAAELFSSPEGRSRLFPPKPG